MNLLSLFRRNAAPVPSALVTRAAANPFAPAVAPGTKVTPPVRKQGGGYVWSLETIRAARDAQLRGQFDLPVRLAEAFRTNDAMFTAYQTRVATQSAIKLLWSAADTDAGRELAPLAEASILTPQHTRESILGTLANHGIAIGYVLHDVQDDPVRGPVVRMTLTEWPLEHVRYNPSTCTLETRTKDDGTITITHGDGRWVVFRKFGVAPWTQDACVLPGALVWAAHGGCLSDWAGASFSHGQPKVVGELREGVPLTDPNGVLTPEAQAILNTLAALTSGDAAAGILPSGAKANMLYNGSTAWQVFKELGLDRGKAAQRIYLGTDAALGSQGGAPGVDIASLFSVASTRIQGDFEALERGYREGMIEPWARMHGFGAADLPSLTYAMPDADGERRSAQEASAVERLVSTVDGMKKAGLDVTQDTIDSLVDVLGISVACTLAAVETKSVPLQLAPTDVARVVKVREARAAQGLPALGDERDELFISELEAQAAAAPVPGAPPPNGDHSAPPDAPTPGPGEPRPRVLPLSLATRAGEIDADGDGKIDEAERDGAASAAGAAIDGDGDGKLDEEDDEDPRVTKSRKAVAKALEKFEAKQAKVKELDAEVERTQADFDAAESALADANDAYEGDAATARSDRLSEIDTELDGLDDGDEARSALEAEANSLRAEDKAAERAHRDASKAYAKAERSRDRAVSKRENANDGTEDLEDAMGTHADTQAEVAYERKDELSAFEAEAFGDSTEPVQMTPEQEAEHARLTRRYEKAEAARVKVDSDLGRDVAPELDEKGYAVPTDPDDARTQAHTIMTGPSGGQYYVNESGEKEYV